MQPGKFSPHSEAWIPGKFQELETKMQQNAAANPLGTSGSHPKMGGIDVNGFINSLRPDGTVGVSMSEEGVFVVYGPDGTTPVARFGPLDNSAPGSYGVEVLVTGESGATWVQLGAQAITWDLIAGKPADFAPLVTGSVPNADDAVNAQEGAHALDADGSVRAYNTEPAGTGSYYAVWVDANQKLCRNTSSIRYKENVRAHSLDPAKVLELQPVIYDRKAGGSNEYGLIAEQVVEQLPELVQWFDGRVDGVRYDLLPVALLDVVRDQENRIRALEGRDPLPGRDKAANVQAPGAPEIKPEPLPYDIGATS